LIENIQEIKNSYPKYENDLTKIENILKEIKNKSNEFNVSEFNLKEIKSIFSKINLTGINQTNFDQLSEFIINLFFQNIKKTYKKYQMTPPIEQIKNCSI